MNIYIKPEDMPKYCGHCALEGVGMRVRWCPLLLDENNDCVEIEDPDTRLPDCPLILIEPWRLESCRTCRNAWNCFIACHLESELDKVPRMVCENWQAK